MEGCCIITCNNIGIDNLILVKRSTRVHNSQIWVYDSLEGQDCACVGLE